MQLQPGNLQNRDFGTVRRQGRKPVLKTVWRPIERRLRPPAGGLVAALEGGIWVGAAIVLRLVADTLLVSLPQLWPLVLLVLLAPAAIAVGLATWAPPLSVLLGYRLVLTAIGLVLGGRL